MHDVVWLMLFFFFKQRTSYEMRISDWSSDVCSSDLAAKLSLPLLRQRVSASGERLERAGLTPRLLGRRWASARDALAPVARVLPQLDPRLPRSEERRVGKECVRTGRFRCAPDP